MSFSKDCLIYNNNILYLIVIIYFFSFFILVESTGNKFLKIRKLSSGEYFVIFENKINIYNSNFTNCSTIKEEINVKVNNINNITIYEYIKDENQIYVLCLINKYLYVYDYSNNQNLLYNLLKELNDLNYDDEGYYFNFIPYLKNGNINFIISLIYEHHINFFYYEISNSFQFSFIGTKIYKEEKKKIFNIDANDISPPELSCHILYLSSNINLECFYSRNWQTTLKSLKYDIENSPGSNDKITIISYLSDENNEPKDNEKNYTNQIRSAISDNYKKKIVCSKHKNNQSFCFANNNNNVYSPISCLSIDD